MGLELLLSLICQSASIQRALSGPLTLIYVLLTLLLPVQWARLDF